MNDEPVHPFRPLGKELKALRARVNETLAEASEAVEIDLKQLASFELGRSRPTEDILLLLISHFGVKDHEAVKLWELAGYNIDKVSISRMASADTKSEQSDTEQRILFTDIVDVIVNNYGVVMNFMQNSGPSTPPVPVAKVGMSREHAKSVLQILQMTLAQTERKVPKLPKRLITPEKPEEKK